MIGGGFNASSKFGGQGLETFSPQAAQNLALESKNQERCGLEADERGQGWWAREWLVLLQD